MKLGHLDEYLNCALRRRALPKWHFNDFTKLLIGDKYEENHWQNFVSNLLTLENFVWPIILMPPPASDALGGRPGCPPLVPPLNISVYTSTPMWEMLSFHIHILKHAAMSVIYGFINKIWLVMKMCNLIQKYRLSREKCVTDIFSV